MAEARPIMTDVGRIPSFTPNGDVNSVGIWWTKWVSSFTLFIVGKGIVNNEQKKALLLHTARIAVQDILFTLNFPDPGEEENVYDTALMALNNHFTPQVNHTLE